MGALDRIKKAWNAFTANEPYMEPDVPVVATYGGRRPDKPRMRNINEQSIVTSLLLRMSIDVSGVNLRHVEIDENGRYMGDMDSRLNDTLNLEANLDQGPRALRQDIVMTMFDKGVAAIVPVDMVLDSDGQVTDILTLRVGEVVAWYPAHVRVSVYNEARGIREELLLEKQVVAIVENPFFAVMNQANSTLQRLVRKLNLLDAIDEQSASGKLDMIIQLPYVIKTETKRAEAERRRGEIEDQMANSKYGVAYTDGTEKITQLNRPVENNLLKQVEFLTEMLYGQLGITPSIMNGTADEATMLNYFDRTIEPIIDAIAEEMRRTFVRNQKTEKIAYFRNPFKLVPLSKIADIVDKLGRNEVMTSNEFRQFLGIPPSTDPNADKLMNSNMPQPNGRELEGPAQLQEEGQDEV